MPHQFTDRLLNVLGPSRMLLVGGSNTQLLGDLLLAGCDAYAIWLRDDSGRSAPHPRCRQLSDIQAMQGGFDTIIVEAKPGTDPLTALLQLFQYAGMPRNLALAARGHDRRKLENGLFLLGWRRHPGSLSVADYPQLTDDVLTDISIYQRIPGEAAAAWPVDDLQQDRAMHMDMLRDSGGRADAHIVRYALAAQMIRPGDTVVDCGCGLGYGSAVMSARSRAGRILGFDLDPGAIDYATANYGVATHGHDRLSFAVADAIALRALPDASVDMVVSIGTIEHIPDWQAALAESRRILRPDGRLIVSVPDRWIDTGGRDPIPYHLHAFDWAVFAEELRRHFIIEARYLQTAPGGFKLQRAARQLQRVPLDSTIDGEWLLAVASVDPLAEGKARRDDFTHPAFQHAFEESRAPVVGFRDGYENPYLYRPLLQMGTQMGERLMDEPALVQAAQRVLDTGSPATADVGGALAVLGYRVLEERAPEKAGQVIARIASYLDDTEASRELPHIARWRLSLSFLAGRLAVLLGDRAGALAWYETTSTLDPQVFSPLLASKVVAAAFHAGLLHLVGAAGQHDKARDQEAPDQEAPDQEAPDEEARDTDGRMERAHACFTRGLTAALAAGRSPATAIVGNLAAPIPFALQQMADVLDMGSQCAAAINALPHWKSNPGLFWQQIDVKRFDLATWTRDLTQINDALLTELRQHIAANQQLVSELNSLRRARKPIDPRFAGQFA